MLIDLNQSIKNLGMNIRGIIHVGGHHGQEYETYKANGVTKIVFVEPCTAAHNRLVELMTRHMDPGVTIINCALGDVNGTATMHTEQHNKGMSNSLLKPKKHTEHYPDIVFTGTEEVDVRRLDDLHIQHTAYNMLVMDVQGFEKYVLMGGPNTLRGIDYIYTEVNDQELYEGCTNIGELDNILQDFKRVETKWVRDKGWGDAIYVRVKFYGDASGAKGMPGDMVNVPTEFKPRQRNTYPPDNKLPFEEWLSANPISGTDRYYLPVHWTAYYVNHKHGKDPEAIAKLQEFLFSLDTTKKYYTVVQYDDGILNDISHLDIKVFAMCGPRVDYPIPLVCWPHAYMPNMDDNYQGRDLFANFVGKKTHQVRNHMLHVLRDQVSRFNGTYPYYLNAEHTHSVDEFCSILARSKFTLCPRGYGSSSFRIYEAMAYGSIPVYISDTFVEPFGIPFEEYGVRIHTSQVGRLHKILADITQEEIEAKAQRIEELLPLFTYQGLSDKIAEVLRA